MSPKEQTKRTVRIPPAGSEDRRAQRTQRLIKQALMDLMHAQSFESITVQEIIDKADVGRSTFYAHFQDKDDLVARFFAEMMEDLTRGVQTKPGAERKTFPIAELFAHVQSQAAGHAVWQGSRGREFLFTIGQTYWIRRLEREMKHLVPAGKQPRVPVPVLAQMVVGAATGLLQWWLNQKMPYTPEEMQDIFDRVMVAGVRAAMDVP